jgi:phosphatidylinositol phospholipase C delta
LSSGPNNKTPQGHSRHLTDLPVYTSAVKYQGFTKLVTYDFNHMFSVSERTAHRILKDGQSADWIKHNFTHLTRVYPKGVRLTSSNFDPRPFWTAGAQLVAINYQTQDDGSLYNDALFHAGGYVLKPLSLRQKVVESPQKFKLRIQVISAQRLPPTGDLYVEITVGEDTYRTKATKGASLTPRWDESVEFTIEAKPSLLGLTFIHMAIRLPRGIVAQWTRPLSDTGKGYRYLPLSDRDRSRYLFATLFARIDVVPLAVRERPKTSMAMSFGNVMM